MRRGLHLLLLPPRPFLDRLVARVVVLWLFFRGVSTFGAVAERVPHHEALVGSPTLPLWVTLAVVLVVRIDMGRRAELVFLGNLGHSFRRIGLWAAFLCVCLEGAFQLLLQRAT